MKAKILYTVGAVALLSACSSSMNNLPNVPLDPPKKVQAGFIRLSPVTQYYVDTTSIWAENEHKNLVNFDTVINLNNGKRIYQDNKLVSHSIREHKVLNCSDWKLTHTGLDYYSEFWGTGAVYTPKWQSQRSVTLQPNSSLGTVAQVICANFVNH